MRRDTHKNTLKRTVIRKKKEKKRALLLDT